ncbi:Vacuolar protein sorting-associated protein 9A [Ranunculus cassubicifolius]
MENTDLFGASTSQIAWHDFMEKMRHPSATDFVKSIKSFVVSITNNEPDPERDSAAVQEFLKKMEDAFRAHSLFAGASEEDLESAGEGLEKYLMTKLFPRLFASRPEETEFDEKLSEKMALVQQFIHPENLDIQPAFQNENSWLLAQKELQKINMQKAPRDKLVCILQCCKVINNLLLNASITSNEHPPGADEFLPVLIYVTIKANPPQLHSNLLYIQRYRSQSRLVSEASYFFTNMLSAESFISNIDAKSISMEETEFEENMESARSLLYGLSNNSDTEAIPEMNHGPRTETVKPKPKIRNIKEHPKEVEREMTKKPSVSDLEKKGATEILKEEDVSRAFQEYPYLYADAADLTVSDVGELLNSYKQLVLKYVCLSKGMNVPILSQESQRQTDAETEAKEMNKDSENQEEDSIQGADYSESEIPGKQESEDKEVVS